MFDDLIMLERKHFVIHVSILRSLLTVRFRREQGRPLPCGSVPWNLLLHSMLGFQQESCSNYSLHHRDACVWCAPVQLAHDKAGWMFGRPHSKTHSLKGDATASKNLEQGDVQVIPAIDSRLLRLTTSRRGACSLRGACASGEGLKGNRVEPQRGEGVAVGSSGTEFALKFVEPEQGALLKDTGSFVNLLHQPTFVHKLLVPIGTHRFGRLFRNGVEASPFSAVSRPNFHFVSGTNMLDAV